jgi:membrane protein required for colicin V production
MGVNWVDFVVFAVLFISGFLAFLRGMVREVLGILAWIGAAAVAVWAFPTVQPWFRELIQNADIADPVAFGLVFLVTLILLSVVANLFGGLVRNSMLSGLDRTLGVLFGIARGAALVVIAYILGGMVMPTDHWPPPVLQARTLPMAYQGAVWATGFVPDDYRPKIYPPPGPLTRAADLLNAPPQGRALGTP